MQNIKAFIFDLGGVLINLDPGRTRQSFIKLGIPHFDELFTVFRATPLFNNLETGYIEPGSFVDAIREESSLDLAEEDIISAWNAMLLDFRTESLRFVEKLGTRYPAFLFSNTNIIHYRSFQQTLRDTTPYQHLDDLFKKAYYSHEIGLRKPDVDSYRHIINEQQLDAEHTLFIDDNPENITGAEKAGLQTLHLKPFERVEILLEPYLS